MNKIWFLFKYAHRHTIITIAAYPYLNTDGYFLSIREKAILQANVFGKQQVYWYLAHTNFVWFLLEYHY